MNFIEDGTSNERNQNFDMAINPKIAAADKIHKEVARRIKASKDIPDTSPVKSTEDITGTSHINSPRISEADALKENQK